MEIHEGKSIPFEEKPFEGLFGDIGAMGEILEKAFGDEEELAESERSIMSALDSLEEDMLTKEERKALDKKDALFNQLMVQAYALPLSTDPYADYKDKAKEKAINVGINAVSASNIHSSAPTGTLSFTTGTRPLSDDYKSFPPQPQTHEEREIMTSYSSYSEREKELKVTQRNEYLESRDFWGWLGGGSEESLVLLGILGILTFAGLIISLASFWHGLFWILCSLGGLMLFVSVQRSRFKRLCQHFSGGESSEGEIFKNDISFWASIRDCWRDLSSRSERKEI